MSILMRFSNQSSLFFAKINWRILTEKGLDFKLDWGEGVLGLFVMFIFMGFLDGNFGAVRQEMIFHKVRDWMNFKNDHFDSEFEKI